MGKKLNGNWSENLRRRRGFAGGAIRGSILGWDRFLTHGGGTAFLAQTGPPHTNLAAHL